MNVLMCYVFVFMFLPLYSCTSCSEHSGSVQQLLVYELTHSQHDITSSARQSGPAAPSRYRKEKFCDSPSWRWSARWPETRSRSSETGGRSRSCLLRHCWSSDWAQWGSPEPPGLQVSVGLLDSLLVPETGKHTEPSDWVSEL